MKNDEARDLCLRILRADSEEDCVEILNEYGYWNDSSAWRYFGDREGNFSVIGSQQSRPEAALVEKVINSIDARLMGECLSRGINPEVDQAPASIREAVGLFFEGKQINGDVGGSFQSWDNVKRRSVGEEITVAVTGERRNPCVTVVDIGEGQKPSMFPETFLSIDRTNKLRIPFVQGRFNMGGTGVLQFCGSHNLQLIVSRRNPNIVKAFCEDDSTASDWGFTVVRRHSPSGTVRNSVYAYLAPVRSDDNSKHGEVLRFQAHSLLLRPEGNEPYVRKTEWGSLVKLFNYDMKGFTSHALMKGGLLNRMEAMLPEPALPIRMYECRDFKGHKGSFATTLSGLAIRLEDNIAGNLEPGFPDSVPFKVDGEQMVARIFAFQKGKAETYRTNEGIIFTVNGQTHGYLPKTFFSRRNVKMGFLADSLLVLIDCTDISNRAREDLFMNSRDRLRSRGLRKSLEENLEEILHRHPGLRALREKRKAQEISERLSNSKPLEEVLASIFKSSPSLAALFLTGSRLAKPHKKQVSGEDEGENGGADEGEATFQGREHPTYFRFKKKKYGDLVQRSCEIGRRCRIDFETDVVNDYFYRAVNPGRILVETLEGSLDEADMNWSLTLYDGQAHASIEISEEAGIGDTVTLQFTVEDDVLEEPFVNVAKIRVVPKVKRNGAKGGTRKRNGKGKGEEFQPSGIQLPKYSIVREPQWADYGFDGCSACQIMQDEDEEDEEQDVYRFYINGDNLYLRTDVKYGNEDPKLMEAQFVYGSILIGLGLIRQYREIEKKAEAAQSNGSHDHESIKWVNEITVEEYVRLTTRPKTSEVF